MNERKEVKIRQLNWLIRLSAASKVQTSMKTTLYLPGGSLSPKPIVSTNKIS